MASPWRLGVAVLAAGASQRFGEGDKLVAPFRGKMLGEHVVNAVPLHLVASSCAWVIASQLDHPCQDTWQAAGFEIELNEHAAQGIGKSVALAAKLATQSQCDALLITLADMPLVQREHFVALVEQVQKTGSIAASSLDKQPMPPAVFHQACLPDLANLSGDQGARDFLKRAKIVPCPGEWLIDIDTTEDIARYS